MKWEFFWENWRFNRVGGGCDGGRMITFARIFAIVYVGHFLFNTI